MPNYISLVVIYLFVLVISHQCYDNRESLGYNNRNYTHRNDTIHYDEQCSHGRTKTRYFILALFCIAVICISIVGNTLSIFVILLSRHLRTITAYHFIISLAIADIGVSLTVTTIRVNMYLNNLSFCFGPNICRLLVFLDTLFPIASITHLMLISIDRCIAITLPFYYVSLFSKTKAKIVIIISWYYVIIWAALGMFPWDSNSPKIKVISTPNARLCFSDNKYYITTLSAVIYFIPMVIITLLYLIILHEAEKQNNKIRKNRVQFGEKRKTDHRKSCLWRRDTRAAKTVFIVFASYTTCFLPHFIITLISYWKIELLSSFYHNYPLVYDVITTIFNTVLPIINSCFNPFIYLLFGSQFRIAFKDIIFKFLKKPRNGILFPDESMAASNQSLHHFRNRNMNCSITSNTASRGKKDSTSTQL